MENDRRVDKAFKISVVLAFIVLTAVLCFVGYWVAFFLMLFPLTALSIIFVFSVFGIPVDTFPYLGMAVSCLTGYAIFWGTIKKKRQSKESESDSSSVTE